MSLKWLNDRLIDMKTHLIVATVFGYGASNNWQVEIWNHRQKRFVSINTFDTKERCIEFIDQGFGLDK